MNVTLEWEELSGDGKRAYVNAKENDGWHDLRIEVDTDDVDSDHAKAAMQTVIDRCNGWEEMKAHLARSVTLLEQYQDSSMGQSKNLRTHLKNCHKLISP
jgi:hypothetical protein